MSGRTPAEIAKEIRQKYLPWDEFPEAAPPGGAADRIEAAIAAEIARLTAELVSCQGKLDNSTAELAARTQERDVANHLLGPSAAGKAVAEHALARVCGERDAAKRAADHAESRAIYAETVAKDTKFDADRLRRAELAMRKERDVAVASGEKVLAVVRRVACTLGFYRPPGDTWEQVEEALDKRALAILAREIEAKAEGFQQASASIGEACELAKAEGRAEGLIAFADHIRDTWGQAYPVEIWPEPPKGSVEPSLRSVCSASMGRHMATTIEREARDMAAQSETGEDEAHA